MDFRRWAILVIRLTVGFAIFILVLFLFKTTHLNVKLPIDSKIFSEYGALVGGIATAALSIASILLIIQSINEARFNNINQQIEGRFFQLIKIHRENRNDILVADRNQKITFIGLVDEYEEIFRIMEVANGSRKRKLNELEILNASFLCFYYGVFDATSYGNNSLQLVSRYLKKYITDEDNNFASELLIICTAEKDKLKSDKRFGFELFNGHQSILGQYYRHLFQTVKYIDENSNLSYREKYNYIKILRAQLSTEEQILFVFNSLSDLGRVWELAPSTAQNRRLITKYNLIKNIPIGIDRGYFSIEKYYPLVHFESEGAKSQERIDLENTYS